MTSFTLGFRLFFNLLQINLAYQPHFPALGQFERMQSSIIISARQMVLAKGPSADNLFERAKHFVDTDPDLGDIAHHFTRDIFTTEGRPKTVSKSWRYRKTCLPHRWSRSYSTVEILSKYTHTIHQRKH